MVVLFKHSYIIVVAS